MSRRWIAGKWWQLGCLALLLAAAAWLVVARWAWPPELELRVMTFNIRHGLADDGENRWDRRKDLVCDLLRRHAPEVAGLQEVYRFQLDFIRQHLPEYGEAGSGRDGGEQGEYCCILFRKDRFELADSGTFWLSDTPGVPSATWGNHYRRICTWATLVDRASGRRLHVYNTHLDHQSQAAREHGLRLIMETIARHGAADPLVLTGDMNSPEDSRAIDYLKGRSLLDGAPNPRPLADSWRMLHPDDPACGTVSRFNGSLEPLKIDAVFVPPGTRVCEAAILRDHCDGRYPSDHYPVSATLVFD